MAFILCRRRDTSRAADDDLIRLVFKEEDSWICREFPSPLCIIGHPFHLSKSPSRVENSKKGRMFQSAGLRLTQLNSADQTGSQKFYSRIPVFVEEKFNGAERQIFSYE